MQAKDQKDALEKQMKDQMTKMMEEVSSAEVTANTLAHYVASAHSFPATFEVLHIHISLAEDIHANTHTTSV